MTRRTFVAVTAASRLAAAPVQTLPTICIFSKHLARFTPEEVGRHAKQIGFSGVDLTVRPKGHVLPEHAAEETPRVIETIRSHGLAVPMITTDLTSASHGTARPILSTAARLGVPYWKAGYYKYSFANVEAELHQASEAFHGLTALSREYGLQAGFHNHSGATVGAAVWDIRSILEGTDPASAGFYFDPGHARIEGGLSGWRISQEIAMPRLKMVSLKDFYWKKGSAGAWVENWCPMGQGMVDWTAVFRRLAAGGFNGPLSLHLEYDAADELAAIARDFEFVRKTVEAAYGPKG